MEPTEQKEAEVKQEGWVGNHTIAASDPKKNGALRTSALAPKSEEETPVVDAPTEAPAPAPEEAVSPTGVTPNPTDDVLNPPVETPDQGEQGTTPTE